MPAHGNVRDLLVAPFMLQEVVTTLIQQKIPCSTHKNI